MMVGSMARSVILRKTKENRESNIQIKVLGQTFNFIVYGGIGILQINQKLRKMQITDDLKMWFKISREKREE
jgi:hypothetical protein